jgi:hypothetical protein
VDACEFLIQFQDFLVPKLDPYEQAIYLHVVRHSRLLGKEDVTVGMTSAAKNGAFGVGQYGNAMSPGNCRDKVRSLEAKGCLKVLASEHRGFRIHALLPNEIPGMIPALVVPAPVDLEKMDFFDVPENRSLILQREAYCCFYCLRTIDGATYVLEHVVSRPAGDNGYRNVVAACRQCNDRKGSSSAEDFMRTLYRESFLSSAEFEDRLSHLDRLRAGELNPLLVAANKSL